MDIKNKLRFAWALLQAKSNNNFLPLAVSWSLTKRCNYRCKYCNEWNHPGNELDTGTILKIMDELKKTGTKIIGFDGGESLLRDDIGQIINHAKNKKFIVSINTNGSLIKKKLEEIKRADLINVSFDGPEKIHNYLRGENSYADVMQAITYLKKYNIPFKLNCTLTKYNLNSVDFILHKAKEWKTRIRFEPVSYAHLKDDRDILESMECPLDEYKKTIEKIIVSRKNNRYIMHSITSLEYLKNWPFDKDIPCFAGKFFCRIEPNADMYPCTMVRDIPPNNCLKLGVKNAFESIKKNAGCKKCWCLGSLEHNCLLSLNLKTIWRELDLFGR